MVVVRVVITRVVASLGGIRKGRGSWVWMLQIARCMTMNCKGEQSKFWVVSRTEVFLLLKPSIIQSTCFTWKDLTSGRVSSRGDIRMDYVADNNKLKNKLERTI